MTTDIGDGHTLTDQINEVLEPYDLSVQPASNDRIGGWQLMYRMLQTAEWQIANTEWFVAQEVSRK